MLLAGRDERLEYLLLQRFIHPFSGIAEADVQFPALVTLVNTRFIFAAADGDCQGPSFWCHRLNSIHCQVQKNPEELVRHGIYICVMGSHPAQYAYSLRN